MTPERDTQSPALPTCGSLVGILQGPYRGRIGTVVLVSTCSFTVQVTSKHPNTDSARVQLPKAAVVPAGCIIVAAPNQFLYRPSYYEPARWARSLPKKPGTPAPSLRLPAVAQDTGHTSLHVIQGGNA